MPFFNPFGNGEVQKEKDKDFSCYIPMASLNRGTYRELKAILNELPEHYLDQTATIQMTESDEFISVGSIGWTGEASTLDEDHFYLTIRA